MHIIMIYVYDVFLFFSRKLYAFSVCKWSKVFMYCQKLITLYFEICILSWYNVPVLNVRFLCYYVFKCPPYSMPCNGACNVSMNKLFWWKESIFSPQKLILPTINNSAQYSYQYSTSCMYVHACVCPCVEKCTHIMRNFFLISFNGNTFQWETCWVACGPMKLPIWQLFYRPDESWLLFLWCKSKTLFKLLREKLFLKYLSPELKVDQ